MDLIKGSDEEAAFKIICGVYESYKNFKPVIKSM